MNRFLLIALGVVLNNEADNILNVQKNIITGNEQRIEVRNKLF
jgi:hypothetical protein